MHERKLYKEIAALLEARENCVASGNAEWRAKHEERLREISRDLLPSGSGIDRRCSIDIVESSPKCITIHASFHHMNEVGYYDGWTEHRVYVKPSLAHDFRLMISGRDRNDILEYLHEVFDDFLRREIAWDEEKEKYVFKKE